MDRSPEFDHILAEAAHKVARELTDADMAVQWAARQLTAATLTPPTRYTIEWDRTARRWLLTDSETDLVLATGDDEELLSHTARLLNAGQAAVDARLVVGHDRAVMADRTAGFREPCDRCGGTGHPIRNWFTGAACDGTGLQAKVDR